MCHSISVGGSVTVNPLLQQHTTGYDLGGIGNAHIRSNKNNGQMNPFFKAGASNGFFHNLLNAVDMPNGRGK